MQNVFIIYGQNGMCTLHVVLCVRHAMPGRDIQRNVFRMYEFRSKFLCSHRDWATRALGQCTEADAGDEKFAKI